MNQKTQPSHGTPRHTLVLNREAIAQTMAFGDYVDAVEMAFRRLAEGGVILPEVVHLPATGGAFHVKSAGLAGEPGYVAVKVNGNFPDNPGRTGLATIQGAITLCDASNGFPLALLDSTEVTTQRTGAATAVALRYLADPRAGVVTVIGCGVQGRVQLEALHHALSLEQVYVFDTDAASARRLAEEMGGELGIPVQPVDDFVQGTRVSQVVVTCTSARNGFLRAEHLRPGCLVAAVGADNEDKQELDPALVASSALVVDSLEQCAGIGELHHALAAGLMGQDQVRAELAELVAGKRQVKAAPGQVTVFDSTGLAIQDVASAGIIFERARDVGLGISVVLG